MTGLQAMTNILATFATSRFLAILQEVFFLKWTENVRFDVLYDCFSRATGHLLAKHFPEKCFKNFGSVNTQHSSIFFSLK